MVSNISGEIITDLKMDVGLMDVQVMPYIIHQYLFQIRFEQYGILSTKITDIFEIYSLKVTLQPMDMIIGQIILDTIISGDEAEIQFIVQVHEHHDYIGMIAEIEA